MNWFDLNITGQLKVPSSNPFFFFLSAIASKATGALVVSHEKVTRQIKFIDGFPFSGASNLKSELPIHYLLKRNILTQAQVTQHYSQNPTSKGNDWKVLSHYFSISESDLFSLQHEHTRFLCQSIFTLQQAELAFAPHAFERSSFQSPSPRWLFEYVDLIDLSGLQRALPELTEHSSVTLNHSVDVTLQAFDFSPEEKGLLIAISNNPSVADILSSSFLGEQKIFTYLAFLSVLGHAQLRTGEHTAREKFVSALSPESKKLREDILSSVETLDKTNYYDWIQSNPNATPIEIKRKAESLIEKVASAQTEALFSGKEHSVWKFYLSRLNHARLVLSDPNKRIEYNRNLVSGSHKISEQNMSRKDTSPIATILEQALRSPENPAYLQSISMEYEKGNRTPELLDAMCACLIAQNQNDKAFEAVSDSFSQQPRSFVLRKRLESSFGTQGALHVMSIFNKNLSKIHYYDMLGVSVSAPVSEIKAAYRNVSKVYHPDLFNNAEENIRKEANAVYKRINAAFSTLKSPNLKTQYDASLFTAPAAVAQTISPNRPQTPHGIKFFKMAEDSYRMGNLENARANLRLAMQMEPSCPLFAQKIKEWEKS